MESKKTKSNHEIHENWSTQWLKPMKNPVLEPDQIDSSPENPFRPDRILRNPEPASGNSCFIFLGNGNNNETR